MKLPSARLGRYNLNPMMALLSSPNVRTSLRFGRVWGIEVGAHASWWLIFGLVTWSFSTGVFPQRYPEWGAARHWVLGLLTSVLFFASVLAHELAHARLALHFGIPVKRIVLFVLGGMAQIAREAPTARAEFWIAIAGPISSLGLSAIFLGLARIARGPEYSWISGPAGELSGVNLLLGLFNMIPGFPLDGGRVLRSIVWGLTGKPRVGTRIAAWAGQAVAFGLFGLGALAVFRGAGLLNGLWLGFVGWFIFNAAMAATTQASMREALRGVPVSRIMSRDFELVPPDISVHAFVTQYLTQSPRQSFLVADRDRVSGVVALDDLHKVPWDKRDEVQMKDTVADHTPPAVVDADDDVEHALWEMSEKDVGQVSVVHEGTVVGLVTRNALLQFLEMRTATEGRA